MRNTMVLPNSDFNNQYDLGSRSKSIVPSNKKFIASYTQRNRSISNNSPASGYNSK